MELSPRSELSKWVRMDSIGSFLLAAYSTPYEVISKAVTIVALEMGEFCHDVIERKRESALQEFPKMFVLWLSHYTFAHRYGYRFLRAALERATLDIATDPKRGEAEAYTLFVLSAALSWKR